MGDTIQLIGLPSIQDTVMLMTSGLGNFQ